MMNNGQWKNLATAAPADVDDDDDEAFEQKPLVDSTIVVCLLATFLLLF